MTKSTVNVFGAALVIQICFAVLATAGIMYCAMRTASAEEPMRVIVHYKDGGMGNAQAAVVGARGNVMRHIFGMNAMSVEVNADGMRHLKGHRHITMVEPDVKRFPLSASAPSTGTPYQVGQSVPYGIQMVQADKMPWGDSRTANRKICIVDSGFDNTHPDLNGNIVTGEYDSGTGWWYTDENNHGSHVAGTIAAINNSGVGVVGVAPNRHIRLHIVKVFGATGWAYSSNLVTAVNKCAAAGANIISMSLGGSTYSATEDQAFAALAAQNILSVAAAGNAGTSSEIYVATALSYPAGYASVMSVAALDENKQWANFSQYNNKVELAAPGVGVLSTVPVGKGLLSSATVGGVSGVSGVSYTAGDMTGSPKTSATAALADFGLGDVVNPALAGKICLIARGTQTFAVKVTNCISSGGVGAIVFNNVAGAFNGTLGTTTSTIPVVTVSDTDGVLLKAKLDQSATVTVAATDYAVFNGTSMATPHVAAVAALLWSYYPICTAAQIRSTLDKSALDLGPVGRDVKFGFGLVQARAAYDRIKRRGCGK